MTMETPATRTVLRAIIQRDYAGSQADFSMRCGVDTADTSRVVAGTRPATVGFVRRAAGVLQEKAAVDLIAAFLSDVSRGVTDAFSVTVAIRAASSAPTLRASDREREANAPSKTDTERDAESVATRTLVALAERRNGSLAAARCRLVFAHFETTARLCSRLRDALARHQLSDLQFATLVVLFAAQPEPISTAILARHTAVSRSAMTDALDKLEARQFATRTRDDRDRRIIYVRITTAGREKLDRAIDDYLHAAAQAAHYLERLHGVRSLPPLNCAQ